MKITGFRATLCGLLPLLLATSAALADDRSDGQAGVPRIQFAVSDHDFGRADAGADLETSFAFKNAGDAVLSIHRVKGG